jgi:16S rRNA (cytosine967-C5)-methyltransferase
MSQSAALRALAATVLAKVVCDGRSLSDILPPAQAQAGNDASRRLLGALVYGSLRWYGRMDALLGSLLRKPVGSRQAELHCLMICGLYELRYLSTPDHAVVAETVNAARRLGFGKAAGLVNAILRRSAREGEALLQELDQDPAIRYAHPRWMLERIRQDWPRRWENVLEENNRQAPFWLRVNLHRVSRERYRERLEKEAGVLAQAPQGLPAALVLDRPVDVEGLPGFDAGLVSVQDGAAQLVGQWLDIEPGQRVLDACAAPGNKTAHMLELAGGDLRVFALDQSAERLERLQLNLRRTGYEAKLMQGDAARPESWWDGGRFDRILLDAPCSASGVIRRHPDIKWLRRSEDIGRLASVQSDMLQALWPLLAPGGRMLYSTCSIFDAENESVVGGFAERTSGLDVVSLPGLDGAGSAMPYGYQLLPGDSGMDGFYYVGLTKE